MKTWIICTGRGADYYSAHETLDEAFVTVARELVHARRHFALDFTVRLDDSGLPRHFAWNAEVRAMTDAEIDAAFVTDKLRRHHKRHRTSRTTDWEKTEKRVEFVGPRVECVSITHVDWERDYLQRSEQWNDNRARRSQLSELVK